MKSANKAASADGAVALLFPAEGSSRAVPGAARRNGRENCGFVLSDATVDCQYSQEKLVMITRFLNRHGSPLYRALLMCSGFFCCLMPAAGFYKLTGLHLGGAQLALGFGIVVGLTIQAMIPFVLVALAERIFVKRQMQHDWEA
jgi:hypothetical protein